MVAETDAGFRRSPWLFLLGAVVFLGSIALFLFDLANGNSVARGLVANGGATVLVVVLAGLETLADPDSHIESRGETLRAVVFFYGLYLLLAGLVTLGATLLGQTDPRFGAGAVAVGGVVVAVTFVTGGAEASVLGRLTTLAGLLGLALVVGSVGLFAYDIATDRGVLRGIAANAVGAGLFILWTAYDMPSDPDSGVDTVPDALGVALLFYGGYLLTAGVVIVATGLLAHERGIIGFLYLALAVVPVVLGFLLAPLGKLTRDVDTVALEESDTEEVSGETDTEESDTGESSG